MITSIIKVKRGQKGYGLSLMCRGADKYEAKDTGIFVSRVLPGGQSEKGGLRLANIIFFFCKSDSTDAYFVTTIIISTYYPDRENDKVIAINNIQPRTVEEAVGIIKDAGKYVMIEVFRETDQSQPYHPEQQKVRIFVKSYF